MSAPDVSSRRLTDLVLLTGRTALVTGGGRGIGAAVTRRLAEAGANVAVADIDKVSAESTAAEVRAATATPAVGIQLDVSDPMSVAEAVRRTSSELGGIDILVNNAGVFPMQSALAVHADEWRRVQSINLDGAFFCAQVAARTMVESGRPGVIVNVASVAAFRGGTGGLAAYSASKGALVALTRALAVELGPQGVRVLAVAPTICATPGVQEQMPLLEASGAADVFNRLAASLPLGRTAVPDDVARAVLFCASDLAAYMTGETLAVDGGHLAL